MKRMLFQKLSPLIAKLLSKCACVLPFYSLVTNSQKYWSTLDSKVKYIHCKCVQWKYDLNFNQFRFQPIRYMASNWFFHSSYKSIIMLEKLFFISNEYLANIAIQKIKILEPFWSCQLDRSPNPAHLPQNCPKWAELTVLFSW